jgi:hypothetical protein
LGERGGGLEIMEEKSKTQVGKDNMKKNWRMVKEEI